MTVGPKLIPLRIRLPYATEEDFVEKYGSNVARGGLFIATRSPKPEGTGLAFELVLADGGRLLRGEGLVVKAQAEGPRAGMTVRFVRLDAYSKALIDRILARRNHGSESTARTHDAAAGAGNTAEVPEPLASPPVETPRAEEPAPLEPAPRPEATAGAAKRGRPVISAEALRKQAATPSAPIAPPPAASPAAPKPAAPAQATPKPAAPKPAAPKPAAPKPAAPKPASPGTTAAPNSPGPANAPGAVSPAPAPGPAKQTAPVAQTRAPEPKTPAPAQAMPPASAKPAAPSAPPRTPSPKPAAPASPEAVTPPTAIPARQDAPPTPKPAASPPPEVATPAAAIPTRQDAPPTPKPAAPSAPASARVPTPVEIPTAASRPTTQDLIANAVLDHLAPDEELLSPESIILEPEPLTPAPPVNEAPPAPAPVAPPVSVQPEPPVAEVPAPAAPALPEAPAPTRPPEAPARPETAREVPPPAEEPRRPVSAEIKGRRRAILDVPVSMPVVAAHPEVVLGIDLGTSQARVAVHHQGTLQLIPLGEARALPSLVAVDASGQLLVGAAARAEAERSPRHAVHGLRRFLGLRARSPLVRALGGPLPFPISAGPHGDASIELHGRGHLLPELAARLLRELKSATTTFLGHEATRAVLCVPAHFDDRQRAAMREAGSLAGLDVLRILNAPSAAALAFGHERGLARKRLLVVELGGGGLDVSVVQLTGDDLEVITTGGDPTVGGMDFDARIAEALASELQAQGLPRPEHPADWLPLLTAAEAAKVALSERDEVSVPLPGMQAPFSLNRERLEALTADLVQRITLVVRHVLESSALSPQGLDEVLLLGGQGRSPLVRRRLEESLGVPVRADLESPHDATHSVAFGAALVGQGLLDAAAGKPGATVSEVLSVPIGVAERGGTLRRVLERNTRLPAEKTLVLPVTPGPLTLALFQGPSPVAAENEYLGTLAFTVERQGEAEVHFSLSQDGILSLAATLPGVKRHAVTLALDMPEDAELEAVMARSPLEGEPEARPGGLLSGLRKLFGRR
ncbi:MAG TPA: TIGR02266 family protein [Archangium sp.]|uniref:TIGR02266 family protein n=1 Tax=Archangium sp. TaxID=1872627 RepID=UPI002E371215|nr:TIGR02266 family protein [Archangium sp.]HEX5748730.1 TIGR02266 family protein [Archangium sp.]